MELVIYNGSPRAKKSNSKLLMDQFLQGFNPENPEATTVHYLANRKNREVYKTDYQRADTIILIFPLYCDSMPGIVKEFFEDIYNLPATGSKKIGFIVQSGFPEAIHSTYIEAYLQKLAKRLKCDYLGTIIKGGVEGIQMMPPAMTRKLFANFNLLGQVFAKEGRFDAQIQAKLRMPLKFSPLRLMVNRMLNFTGIGNFYWNINLKKNKAYQQRFDKPFGD
jgi:hypothetical protein